jgi:hypothetical protein
MAQGVLQNMMNFFNEFFSVIPGGYQMDTQGYHSQKRIN